MRLRTVLLLPLALASLVLSAAAAPVDSVVKSVTGDVQAAPPGGSFSSISAGQKLKAGTTIKTGAGGQAVVCVTPGAATRIDENTTVTLDDMEFSKNAGDITRRKATLDLKSGTVSSLIDHSTPDVTDFTVQTPQGAAAARGTFYAVTVKDGNTFYKVQEGKVGVSAKDDTAKKKSATPPVKDNAPKPALPA